MDFLKATLVVETVAIEQQVYFFKADRIVVYKVHDVKDRDG
jgi:hypothetical protein